jgi:aryl-alcohol dehydrogenase-like predicted oxidoreductase
MGETGLASADGWLPAGAPRLGFGCGDLYGGERRASSAQLIEAALDVGVRYFDVARLYGNGTAEDVLGEALAGVRDQVVIASKAGILPWSMLTSDRVKTKATTLAHKVLPFIPAGRPARERYGAFRPDELRRSVEHSLKALRTEYLDLLLLHECQLPDATSQETLSLFERLRAQGKVRRFGVATDFPTTVRILEAAPGTFDAAQFPSDALNGNVSRLPRSWTGLTVTHSALKSALPALAAVAADPARAAAWREAVGVPLEDRSALAELLLQDALAANPGGVTLFSTSRPERVREAVAAARNIDPERLRAFRQAISELALRSPAAA